MQAIQSVFGIGCTAIYFDSVVEPPTTLFGRSWLAAVTINPRKIMSTKSPECWANDPQARGVRVEIVADHSMLLPHDEFAFAELKSEGDEQQLWLVFAMHEVLVRGYSLRRIETATQRSELSLLTALSGKQRSLIPDGQPVVLEVFVKEIPCAGMHSHVSQE